MLPRVLVTIPLMAGAWLCIFNLWPVLCGFWLLSLLLGHFGGALLSGIIALVLRAPLEALREEPGMCGVLLLLGPLAPIVVLVACLPARFSCS